jgi:hypothetical protein
MVYVTTPTSESQEVPPLAINIAVEIPSARAIITKSNRSDRVRSRSASQNSLREARANLLDILSHDLPDHFRASLHVSLDPFQIPESIVRVNTNLIALLAHFRVVCAPLNSFAPTSIHSIATPNPTCDPLCLCRNSQQRPRSPVQH